MKVLVCASYTPSLINFRGSLLTAMVNAGHEVMACAPENDATVIEKLKKMGVAFARVPLKRAAIAPFFDIYALWSYYRLMRSYCPDVVFAYTIKPVIYSSWAARLARVRHCYSMITGLGSSFEEKPGSGKLVSRLVHLLYRFGLKTNEGIFFQNPDDQKVFTQLKIVSPQTKTILVNGSGVDLKHYAVTPLLQRPVTFLLIARIISEKGIEQYVEAARQLKERDKKISFLLVGKFDSNPSAISREKVMAWHKEYVIHYVEGTDDVRPVITTASVYVLPSYYREGTPRTVLEAMSMGRPIITTDAPGCRETIKPTSSTQWEAEEKKHGFKIGTNGILVPVKDVKALAAAMKFFIDHPEQIAVMGKESRRYAEERYDVHKVNAVILRTMRII